MDAPAATGSSPAATAPARVASPESAPVIRRIGPADTARMRALRLEMLADAPLAFLERLDEAAARPHDQIRDRLAAQAASTEVVQFVADLDARFLAHTGAVRHRPDTSLLFAVYVTPAWRRRGLLAELVQAVAGWSRQAGRSLLELEVVVGNDRAVRAYQRLGFVDTGIRTRHPTVAALTELTMRRPA